MKQTILIVSCMFCQIALATTASEYEQQFARNPNDTAALYNAGVLAFKENRLDRAQECFNALKQPPSTELLDDFHAEQLFYNAGNTEIKLKQYEDAVKSFETVLEYNPDNERARAKRDYAKKMLEEQQKQEDQQENQENKQDQQQNKKEKSQQQKEENQEQREQEESSDEEQQEQEQDSQDGSEQDEQEQQEKSQQQSSNNNEKEEQKQQQQKTTTDQQKSEDKPKEQKNEPELTAQEQKLLADVENLDKKMQAAFDARTLKKAQGGAHARNNW